MRSERGQASAELVAVLPLLVIAVVAAAQLAAAGWALWSAGNAARAGARAAHVGGDAERSALDALPAPLRERAVVEEGDSVEVRVRAPGLVPGIPSLPVTASAGLDPLADG